MEVLQESVFLDLGQFDKGLIIGPGHGANRLFRQRAKYQAGFYVGLHTHEGDESFEVQEGRIRFTAGDQQMECGPGYVVFIPPGVEHGFMVLEDSCLNIFSEQKMGLFVKVLEPDGTSRVEEVYMEHFPFSRDVPPGQPYTPREYIRL